MNPTAKTILVVDDEEKIVDVVKSYLQRNGYTVASASNGRAALERFERLSPALLILDWMLPDLSGEEVCREVRKKSAVPVIMLTARAEEESVLKGFRFGADDYVIKPFSPRQLVARVEAVLRRAESDSPSLLTFYDGGLVIDLTAREVTLRGAAIPLTPNEFSIFSTLARHPKKVFTRDELLNGISDENFEGFDRVIDTHVKNIRQKLGEEPRSPRFIQTVYGVGYKFGGGQP